MFHFTIEGKPKGKERPRAVSIGGYTRVYTPPTTHDYEELVKYSYLNAGGRKYPEFDMLRVTIRALFKVPKSKSKKFFQLAYSQHLRPTIKPDIDNIAKIVLDGLNKVAFQDDKQVVELRVAKLYSPDDQEKVEVFIEKLVGEKYE